jgi:hypothetical protein
MWLADFLSRAWIYINAMYPAGQQIKNCCPLHLAGFFIFKVLLMKYNLFTFFFFIAGNIETLGKTNWLFPSYGADIKATSTLIRIPSFLIFQKLIQIYASYMHTSIFGSLFTAYTNFYFRSLSVHFIVIYAKVMESFDKKIGKFIEVENSFVVALQSQR